MPPASWLVILVDSYLNANGNISSYAMIVLYNRPNVYPIEERIISRQFWHEGRRTYQPVDDTRSGSLPPVEWTT